MGRHSPRTHDASDESETDESIIGRRSYLKVAGLAVASAGGIAGSSNVGRAASGGYGTFGFGETNYGGVKN